jgi:DivIVA domain-containing protein
VANLPPVLLPADAAPADVDRVRFSLGLRGYRMDQVDQVLDDLRDQLAARNAEVERLRTQLADARHGAAASAAAADLAPDAPGRAGPEGGA